MLLILLHTIHLHNKIQKKKFDSKQGRKGPTEQKKFPAKQDLGQL